LAELSAILGHARDLGVANVEQIARAEHTCCGLSCDDCLIYLRDHLHFYLGPRELAGLRLFHDQAARLGLLSREAGVWSALDKPVEVFARRDACPTKS
jgi:hypothetical protein